ncbi:DUF4214 domain-containing protein [Rhodovarius crocodyli]|uniref:DUF4214 domain-containing protein n=1 Tax=Rhodovarius crocodyli TaxID=1979269 RepID=A0A437MDM8_9PROT|nr:DUF4214 domain-containing protein [Rhodovarius crocodyli]RVT95700.1 DUF4214 domain-containing protein [Rhodovarius crocodyli]
MAIAYAPPPTGSGQTLVFDGSAETLPFSYYSDALWRYFATGTNPDTANGIAWKTTANAVDPWPFVYSAYDLTGGSGNDVFTTQLFGPGNDRVDGGAGDDRVSGTSGGNDYLDGGTGADTLNWTWNTAVALFLSMAGTVFMVGGTTFTNFESHQLTLGTGNDTLTFEGVSGSVSGSFATGLGNDTVIVRGVTGSVRAAISTGEGDDTLIIDHTAIGVTSFNAGNGTDRLIADLSQASRVFIKQDPSSTPSLPFSSVWLTTAEGLQMELIYRYPTGQDRPLPEIMQLTLSAGNDDLGDLRSFTGLQSVNIDAGAGNDILVGGSGDDVINGGEGTDSLYISPLAGYAIRLDQTGPQRTAAGNDTLLSVENLFAWGGGAAWFIGNADNNILSGSSLADRLEGGDGDDDLRGASGDDVLLGGAGNDSLSGGDGNDRLYVGSGMDTAAGGAGSDTLYLSGPRRAGTSAFQTDGTTIQGGVIVPALKGTLSNATGTTTFTGIESFSFTDGRLVLDPSDPAMQVARLFHAALGRAPDPMSLNHWIAQRQAGVSLETIGGAFVNSEEFRLLHGNQTNSEFVAYLYTDVLSRAPDVYGFNSWLTALNSGALGRGSVLAGFTDSPEYKNRFGNEIASSIWDQDELTASIARLYQATLGRHPEEYGLVHWRGRMSEGLSYEEIVPGFLDSAEFQTVYGATTNTQFVSLLYNNVLGRAPDADGYAHWTSRLDQGLESRVQVVIGFAESYEFRVHTMGWIEGGIVLA